VVAVVVYESIWGNTATLAWAIGQGLGMEARVLSTLEASADAIAGADLLVLGAPVHSYGLPEFVAIQAGRDPEVGADGAIPGTELLLMRDWLEGLPPPGTPVAVFEIRIGNLEGEGGAREVIEALLARGHSLIVPAESFQMERFPLASGPGGWIRPEEREHAREWGARLARLVDAG
jgi:hypothetical protein